MRKILLCADIHGNFQALQALMKTKCAKTADEIYVLGDLVCMGPQPNEVIDFIKDNPKIQAIMGNHDKWVAVEPPPSSINAKRIKVKHHEYMTAVITDENLEYLRNLPYYKIIEFHGKKFYLTHYGWKDNFTEVMPHPDTIENKDNIKEVFPDIQADCIFFGHDHDPLNFEYGGTQYICVGTLGMSKYGTYIVLTLNDDGNYIIERKSLHIQIYKTIRLMHQLKYPRYNLYAGYLLGKFTSIYADESNKGSLQVELVYKSAKPDFRRKLDKKYNNTKKNSDNF